MDFDEDSEKELPILKSEQKQRSWLNGLSSRLFTPNPKKSTELDHEDSCLILFFVLIGILSRVIRIQYPKNCIFDETMYGYATNNYLTGTFFDMRDPPLASLILTGIVKFAGYKGEYSFIQKSEYPTMFYAMMRIVCAFFGGFCVPITYLLMRFSKVSKIGSFTAALVVVSDPLLIVQSRHYMGDSIFHCFSLIALISMSLFEAKSSLGSLIFEGIALGFAVSCKHSGVGLIALAVLRQFPLSLIGTKMFAKRAGTGLACSLILLAVAFAVHFTFYSLHLTLLPFQTKDILQLPRCITDSLIDPANPDWIKRSESAPLVLRTISLIVHKLKHTYESQYVHSAAHWWEFALGRCKWIELWHEGDRYITCCSNLLTWIPVFLAFIFNLFRLLLTQDWHSQLSFSCIGYICCLLAAVAGHTYISDYSLPLIIGVVQLVLLIESIDNLVCRGFFYYALLFCAVFGFMIWNPLAYGKTVRDIDFKIWI